MRILVVTVGSAGDVHPFIAIGKELQRRGHQVTLFTGDYFAEDIRKAGLEFAPMFTAEEYKDIMDHPDLWDPVAGFKLLYRKVFVPIIPIVYRFIADRYLPGETGVVTSSLGLGARVAQEKLGVPTVSVHLQPIVFRSVYDTPVFPTLVLGPGMPRWIKRLIFRLVDRFIDPIITPELNAFRKSLGLKPVRRVFEKWIHSPECVLGLFPEWFADPQPDWPARTHLAGFPLFDSVNEHPLSAEARRFLDAGEAPVIFTAGSAMKQGRWFFDAAVQACAQLKCRGLFINRFRDQVPEILPPEIQYAEYAPFSQVFPRARAVVHHGGIGTTAQVLAAGVPQVVVPISFDQPDQAMRIERLKVGVQVPRKVFDAARLTAALKEVGESPEMAARAHELSERMNGPKHIAEACTIIEQAFRRSVLSS